MSEIPKENELEMLRRRNRVALHLAIRAIERLKLEYDVDAEELERDFRLFLSQYVDEAYYE